MQKILLDTNFLLIPAAFNVDIFSEFNRIFPLNEIFILDKSLNEYLIYLEYQPKNIKVITQRIMFLSNNISSINNIINTLSKSDLTEAKIIHSKLEFKLNK